jgi:hypothetical protein
MVDLPAPVGPVMAKSPAFANAGVVKSILNSPLREFKFLKCNDNIFILCLF